MKHLRGLGPTPGRPSQWPAIVFITGSLLMPGNINQVRLAGIVLLAVACFGPRLLRLPISPEGTVAVLGLSALLIAGVIVRGLIEPQYFTIREPGEITRWVPLLVIIVLGKEVIALRWSGLVTAALVVTGLDVAASLAQLTTGDAFKPFWLLFNSPIHYSLSLGVSSRTLAFSVSPGEHGSLLVAMSIILLTAFVFQPRPLYLIGILAAIGDLATTQSQTGILALAVVVGTVGAIIILRRPAARATRWAITQVAVIAVVAAAPVAWLIRTRLRYLDSLFEQGTSRHSYQGRLDKWATVLETFQSRGHYLVFGGGKFIYGYYGTAMDSDLLYMLTIYGLPVLALSLLVLAVFLLMPLFVERVQPRHVALAAMASSALVESWANQFITDIRLVTLMAVVALTFDDPTPALRRSAGSARGRAGSAADVSPAPPPKVPPAAPGRAALLS